MHCSVFGLPMTDNRPACWLEFPWNFFCLKARMWSCFTEWSCQFNWTQFHWSYTCSLQPFTDLYWWGIIIDIKEIITTSMEVVCTSQGCSCLCFLFVKFVFIVVNNCIMVVNFASFGSFWQWLSVSFVHFCRCLFNLEYFVASFGLSTQWSQGRHCHVIRSWHAINIPPVL